MGQVTLLLLLLAPAAAGAQTPPDRPLPPPVSILLPEQETGAARQDTAAVKRTALPTLALPDIVVFGSARATIRDGSKLFTADKRTALDREIQAPTGEKSGSRAGWGGARLVAASEPAALIHRLRAYSQVGNWGEVLAGLDGWMPWRGWQLSGGAGLERSDGHLPSSRYLLGRFDGTALHRLGEKNELRLHARWSGGRQAEWGAPILVDGLPAAPTGAERGWFETGYGVQLDARPASRLGLGLAVAGRHAGLSDEVRTPGTTHRPTSNGYYLSASGAFTADRFRLGLEVGLEGDHLSGPAPAQDVALARVELELGLRLSGTSSLSLGGLWYRLDDDLAARDRIQPRAEFQTRYSERLDLFVRYRPGVDYLDLGRAHEVNPFVANEFRMVPREEDFHLGVGLHYEVVPGLVAGFEVARRQFDRLPLWRRAPLTDIASDGLFVLSAVNGVMLNETRLTLDGRPGSRLGVEGGLVLRQPSGAGVEELPHVPRLELDLGLEAEGPWSLGLAARLHYLGPRSGDPAGSAGRKIPAATVLGLRVSRPFGPRLVGWVALHDLLDTGQVTWEGYPLPGRSSMVGLSVRF